MSDAERLDLLKEIGGTRIYDERRAESVKIMNTTDRSREGVEEVIQHYEQRLSELQEEKEELTQYLQLDSERRGLEYTIYDKEQKSASDKLQALQEQKDQSAASSEALHAQVMEKREARIDTESRLKASSGEVEKLEGDLKQLQKERTVKLQARAKADLVVKDLKDRVQSDTQRRHSAESELASITNQAKSARTKLEKLQATWPPRLLKRKLLELASSHPKPVSCSSMPSRAALLNSSPRRNVMLFSPSNSRLLKRPCKPRSSRFVSLFHFPPFFHCWHWFSHLACT